MIMLARPAIRNVRSSSSVSLASVRFIPFGFANGTMPSSTRYRANAAARSLQCMARTKAAGRLLAPGVLEILEELAVRSDHEHVALLAERAAVGLQATKERI